MTNVEFAILAVMADLGEPLDHAELLMSIKSCDNLWQTANLYRQLQWLQAEGMVVEKDRRFSLTEKGEVVASKSRELVEAIYPDD